MPKWDEPGLTWDNPLFHWDDPRSVQEILNSQPKKTMFEVVLDLKGLSAPEFVARAKAIRAGIAKSPAFSTLADELVTLDTLIATVETRQTSATNAKTAWTNAVSSRDEAVSDASDHLFSLASSVGELAVTEADVNTAEMRVKDKPVPKPIPNTPTGLELAFGDEDGELSGHFNGQPGMIDRYDIALTTTDPTLSTTVWQIIDSCKKSRFDLTGLPSGQKVWIRVRAVNNSGKSGWSDPACKRVP